MKINSTLKYYFKSIPTLIFDTNFWIIPIVLTKKPILLKTSKNLNFYVNNLMDIWTIKEVILDRCYENFCEIKKGDIVIDVGASIGDFSISASKKANKVYSVEMNKELIKTFKKNIEINHAKGINIINKRLTSLNYLFDEYKISHCNFLKIDCEGGEYEIFKNTSPSTLKKIKYIAFEIHLFDSEMKKNYLWLKKLLLKNKFSLKELDNPVHDNIKFLFCKK
jgi:hypothetical protein